MHRPPKRNAKRSKVEQMTDAEEIRELAKVIAEYSNARSEELEEPFDHYAHQLKTRWHQDVKGFSSRLVKGYEALIEQLRAENPSEHD
jgi:phage host-nuclease inhibitor protein Gam